MYKRKADLHIHTSASDGTYSINEIIKMAEYKNLIAIAVTDHDTVDAFNHLKQEPENFSLIRGLELSCNYNGSNVHILGYFIDIKNKILNNTLRDLREKRIKRLDKILQRLKIYGVDIEKENLRRTNENASVGRTHIAREMVRLGYVKTGNEAFEKYIGDDMPCYEPSTKLSINEAVKLINEAGGVSILAHPGLIKNNPDYSDILSFNIEGIEVFHPKHTNEQRKFFYNLAVSKNLLITGGSDFHTLMRNNKLAQAYTEEKYLTAIYNYYENKY